MEKKNSLHVFFRAVAGSTSPPPASLPLSKKVVDGHAPVKQDTIDDQGMGTTDHPSRLSGMCQRFIGPFLSYRVVLVVTTSLWLVQGFVWGGFYVGCGLTIVVSVAALAWSIVKDYFSRGSVVSRWAGDRCDIYMYRALLRRSDVHAGIQHEVN